MATEVNLKDLDTRVRRATLLSIVAVGLALGAVAISFLTGRPPPEPTPTHPFSYFKLTNSTGKPIVAGETKLEGNRKCTDTTTWEYSTVQWTLASGSTTIYKAKIPTAWLHVRGLKLFVKFQDGTTATDMWTLPDANSRCYADTAATCELGLSGSTVTFDEYLPTASDLDDPCP